jgi:bifunctional enzyme CysN/CysC
MLGEDEFFEIFVDTPLSVAEDRDVKGLYKRARAGEIKNFTGIDSEYQPPVNPDLRIDTTATSADEAAKQILDLLRSRYRLDDAQNVMNDGGGI